MAHLALIEPKKKKKKRKKKPQDEGFPLKVMIFS
jgi:hypothetical protein